MFNVFKHSKAGAVKVDLFMTKDKLQLSIEDNGVGFNVKDLNTMGFAKMGLRGYRNGSLS
jgi:signal transduction histidine kinase